jgi:hypothetical protein
VTVDLCLIVHNSPLPVGVNDLEMHMVFTSVGEETGVGGDM